MNEREKNEKEMCSGLFYSSRWNKIIVFFLALMNSAHLSLDMHCSSGAKKIDLAPLLEHHFSVSVAKI